MENKASFDLNSEIRRWREALAQSAALSGNNLDELEGHLRDSVGDLQSRGLSDEEAFLVAAKRVGGSQALVNEFSKVRPGQVWIDRSLWIIVGVALFEVFWSVQSSVVLSSSAAFSLSRFLPLIISMAPIVMALLTLRSIVHGTGWTPRTLNSLARTPLKLSVALFCLGLSTIAFRVVALSSRVTNRMFPEIASVFVSSALGWLVLSLIVFGVAHARARRTTA